MVKGQVAVFCRALGIFFQETALYYFLSPQLKTHSIINLSGLALSVGAIGLKVAGEAGGVRRERRSVIASHVMTEMITLGAFVSTVVGMIFSKEHRSVCLCSVAIQLPYWGLKFYREVPHLGEKTVVAKKPTFIREIPREEMGYIGRKEIIENVRDVLWTGENIILLGDSGVGKTHLAIHLYEGAITGDYVELKGVRFFETSAKDLIAGGGIVGTKEKRVKELFAYLNQFDRVVLFVDEIWQLVGTGIGMHGTTDLAGDFLTEVERGNISVIGATTPDKAHHIKKNSAFNDRFEWIIVQKLSPVERLEVLQGEIQRQDVEIPIVFVSSISDKISLREAKRKIRLIAARMKRTGCSFEDAKKSSLLLDPKMAWNLPTGK